MDKTDLYKNVREHLDATFKTSKDNIQIARNIYFDFIKLVIGLSIGSIPLIGLLIANKGTRDVKWLILCGLLSLIFSIFFGVTTLIKTAWYFRQSSEKALKEIKLIHKTSLEGDDKLQSLFDDKLNNLLGQDKLYEDLNYFWSILQLIFFFLAVVLVFLSLCKIL